MPSYVVETFVPADRREGFERTVAELRAACDADRTSPRRGRVRHVRSFLMPGDEMGFHVLEAAAATRVAAVTEAAGIEFERVVEVVTVDAPATEETR
jgi:hypothetical protein